MKSLWRLLLLVVLPAAAFCQQMEHPMEKAAPSEAQQTFTQIKALAGEWEGAVAVEPPMPGMKDQPIKPLHLTMRVTSRGHTLVHEFQEAGTVLDATKYDHPVTMFYVDDNALSLVHYCDAGNRPHMVARKSADGKTIDFDFVDLSGSNQHGHMAHATFTMVDADHHVEEWTYMLPGDKPVHARMTLTRTK
ncbi:hypothetical protein Acid345_2981 [Candidatus Koribacter versatilis Ellin345]|uniref:DUF1579 domain-containing protein n=1 Tax=Koribacter versatilis (strain Ellin345) TaxID=204669 RepID=Q1IMB8_KORVE|nr:hypothetical protein [Candidatus Koribacter versatilis]ABF41982.1 hypothetical protein Acid345_2981 [Candidatus Koribacter versatilis Ellin345]